MSILITNLQECAVNDIIIYKRNPEKVVLIVPNDKNDMIISTIKRLKEEAFPNTEFEEVDVSKFDVVNITRKIDQIIKREKGKDIYVNVTEGHKTMFLGGVFAASLNKDDVEGAFYLRQDNHELMPVPLIDFSITGKKRGILEELDKSNKKVSEITKRLKVNKSFVYSSLKDLIKRGCITEDWRVTDAGKICLMSN